MSPSLLRARLVALAVAIALSACADKTPPPPRTPTDGAVPPGDGAFSGWPLGEVCMRGSEALCNRNLRCASNPATFDLAACIADSASRCAGTFAAYARSVASGALVFDPVLAEACYGAYTTAPCELEPDNDEACEGFLVGTLPPGAMCHAPGSRDECETGYCRFDMFMCPGVCSPLVPAGGMCNAISDLRCAEGFFCDVTSHTCVPLGAEGEGCGVSGRPPCRAGLVCLSDRCTRYKTSGEPCTEHIECAGLLYCLDDLCRAEAVPGGECAFRDHCPEGQSCADWDGDIATDWTCAPSIADGMACTSSLECMADRLCSGTCTPYPAIGQPCDGICAAGAWCPSAGGTCMAIGALGDPCEDSFTCEGLLFCDPATHQCANGHDVGEACITDDPFSCTEDLVCDTATMRCSRRLTAGQACTDSFQCESYQCEDAICLPSQGFCTVT